MSNHVKQMIYVGVSYTQPYTSLKTKTTPLIPCMILNQVCTTTKYTHLSE